ncbi:MAG TPA: ATP-binding cassette domain-containing protein [Verrucomicrobiota bacterium]|nr:ABC transporter ATP-binding protein [Verrucomicrobiales bacterium]HRI12723.1 ATP-binding cassette domain-containing protein [Verrucomicrobiota bacterium]
MTAPVSNGIPVSVRKLRKSYGSHVVLESLSLEIAAGELFVMMGPSGSGKSVFLRHLIGLEEPDSGEIEVAGQRVSSEVVESPHRLAMVFQTGGLLNSLTVEENVGLYLREHRLKPPAEITRVVAEKLSLVQLGVEDGAKYPAELSGGMRKRVAIARALVVEPQLILYDEPTSELDPLVALTIGREIVNLNRRMGATTVVVTHDRDLAFGIADRIAFLAEGRLLALGTPAEVRQSSEPLIQRFLAAEFK